ncbi:conserved hypothetical protein [Talaromyces stipitatus ATCC 10500]|uniref:Methyltransferase domain-containing protein n=1 Tax=Talaromyces stipitatus (strain ATCC 10500 / CBS 375.48 / QM 6759 / NRRL 1006) TaxID=441959 RepID=B8M9G5_TALSN|nr:uncharacterized protein TSTA_115240 [Talaromyces stipitatus ATCC 10500]EED17725.1 conserved hypothetical protein [Talaromyces stipitatus ATCC 10500]
MSPYLPLPLHEEWKDIDTYIKALLSFATSTPLFLNLCGGVHILDFLTSEPDLYTTLFAEDWRQFFHEHDLYDILDLILTDDLTPFRSPDGSGWKFSERREEKWKNGPLPPPSLLDYINDIRRLSLRRDFTPKFPPNTTSAIPRRLAVGMKDKKLHEVEHFSKYVDSFATSVSETRHEPITHIADFGSGQNYLGRTLAYSYNRHIIAIERKHAFIKGAQGMDVTAKMAKKKVVGSNGVAEEVCTACLPEGEEVQEEKEGNEEDDSTVFSVFKDLDISAEDLPTSTPNTTQKVEEVDTQPRGTMDYIEHNIKDGYLEPIIRHVVNPETEQDTTNPSPRTKDDARVLVVSLHSCGNLLHHGIRSLILNPSVVAIAMIGCCYNLLTERLGPPTYKLPVLRHMHQRLSVGATQKDPHGFPMSNLFENYPYSGGKGIKFNITARMMACQAPFNWSQEETKAFFTRHYYRALLQKFFVDHGIAPKPELATFDVLTRDRPTTSSSDTSPPLIIGTLRKTAYKSFINYAQTAIAKLAKEPAHRSKLLPLLENEEATIAELEKYVSEYAHTKKSLSIVWILMSFSATLVEAMIVIDRWQYLREHMASGIVQECWVEPVFDYAESPRNLAVIGIKN